MLGVLSWGQLPVGANREWTWLLEWKNMSITALVGVTAKPIGDIKGELRRN